MRFDYYTAGIDEKPSHVIGMFESYFDLCDVIATTPKNGYERAYNIKRGDTVHARLQFGGQNVGGRVWASASGNQSVQFAEIVREEYRDHLLLRADVAIDYCESGAWDSLAALAIENADTYRIKVKHLGDFHRQEDGRTLYIGSRNSPVMHRLYEKGKQTGGDPNHVRAELELKPKTLKAREIYARCNPEQMWFASKWSQHFLATLTGASGMQPAPPGTVRDKTDHQRALEHLAKQYGRILGIELERLGGDVTQFGQYIADLITQA
jgi:hypothetical protein